jgi:hypothetical protein
MPDISNVWAVFASRGSILVKKEKKKRIPKNQTVLDLIGIAD